MCRFFSCIKPILPLSLCSFENWKINFQDICHLFWNFKPVSFSAENLFNVSRSSTVRPALAKLICLPRYWLKCVERRSLIRKPKTRKQLLSESFKLRRRVSFVEPTQDSNTLQVVIHSVVSTLSKSRKAMKAILSRFNFTTATVVSVTVF